MSIAHFGEVHPKILAAFDIKLPVSAFEIVLDALPEPKAKKGRAPFAPSPFQAIERDFAFVVDRGVAAGDLIRAVKNAERVLIDTVTLFDVYEGKGVPEGKKVHRHRGAPAAQGQDPDRCRDRSGGGQDRGGRGQTGRDASKLDRLSFPAEHSQECEGKGIQVAGLMRT